MDAGADGGENENDLQAITSTPPCFPSPEFSLPFQERKASHLSSMLSFPCELLL
jgi:hypothetical protein